MTMKKGTPQSAMMELMSGGLENNTAGTATRGVLVLATIRFWMKTSITSSEGRTTSSLFLDSCGNKLSKQIALKLVYEPRHHICGSPEQGYGKPRRR